MGKGVALKGDKYVLKGCREMSKSYHNIFNWALKRDGEMLKGDGKAFMCDWLFLEVTGMD